MCQVSHIVGLVSQMVVQDDDDFLPGKVHVWVHDSVELHEEI